jgi:hypothetical protein
MLDVGGHLSDPESAKQTTNTHQNACSNSVSCKSQNQNRPNNIVLDSIKFGRKMRYVNYLNELEQYMHLEQLLIPKQVLE